MKYLNLFRTAALVLAVLLCFAAGACSSSQLDRFVGAVEAAQELPAVFGVTGDQARLVSDGFGAVAAAARDFRARPDADAWRRLVTVFQDVRARPSWQRLDGTLRARVDAVFNVAERLLNSIEPSGTAPVAAGPAPKPDFNRVDSADLRELEQLVGRRK